MQNNIPIHKLSYYDSKSLTIVSYIISFANKTNLIVFLTHDNKTA